MVWTIKQSKIFSSAYGKSLLINVKEAVFKLTYLKHYNSYKKIKLLIKTETVGQGKGRMLNKSETLFTCYVSRRPCN